MKQYIFGYGSLINKESIFKTLSNRDTIEIYPVRVHNIKRGWYIPGPSNDMYLGVQLEQKSKCNGVIFEVNNDEIDLISAREKYYDITVLPNKQIEFLESDNILNDTDIVYIYIIDNINPKIIIDHVNYFITKKYLNICIEGCININNKFSDEFFNTTYNWMYKIIE